MIGVSNHLRTPYHSILVPLPFSGGDWISRVGFPFNKAFLRAIFLKGGRAVEVVPLNIAGCFLYGMMDNKPYVIKNGESRKPSYKT